MTTEFKKIVFVIALILCVSLPVYGDWQPSDGHKMHFPQLPNPMGWDIDLRPYELADDWQCSKTGDVNDIHFWISWKGDANGTIPNIQVKIYSNDPNPPSKPAAQLWSQTIYDFSIRLIDPNGHQGYWIPTGPNSTPTLYPNDHNSYYQVNIKNIQNAFHQVEGQIYWLSLRVSTTSPPAYRVGWKTSLNHFMDAAVIKYGTSWQPLYEPNSTIPIDFAFVITGGQEPNEEPNIGGKWLQRPDLSSNGLDVKASDPYLILADDFECNKSTKITDITIWGSWRNDVLPPNGANDVWFTLSIHSDIPASQGQNGYSMPNEVLWLRNFTIGEANVSIERQGINEGWWDPYYGEYLTIGDQICWKYVFHIPPEEAFCQMGEPNYPIVYWLDVQAHPSGPVSGAQFGWKSSINHWNDDAVWAPGSEPYTGTWNELRYPLGHPLYYQSIDLAFAIDGNIPCIPPESNDPNIKFVQPPDESQNGTDIRCDRKDGVVRMLADDFICFETNAITDVHLWGSWLGEPNMKGQIQSIHLSIHSDIPAWQNPYGYYSMPGPVLWQKDFPDGKYNEIIYKKMTYYETWWDPYSGTFLPAGDKQIWEYCLYIDPCEAFMQQGEPNNPVIYWLDVFVQLKSAPSQAQFGWKTSSQHFNDRAVYYNSQLGYWLPLYLPTQHPLYDQQVDMAFSITAHPDCFPDSDPYYSTWVALGKPSSWCFPRQCHGDATGSTEGGGKNPTIWVGGADLTILVNAWRTKGPGDAGYQPGGADATFNAAADFDHKTEGGGKNPTYRVGGADLSIIVLYWKDTSEAVPPGGIPPIADPNCCCN
jgi:hypothetical protein